MVLDVWPVRVRARTPHRGRPFIGALVAMSIAATDYALRVARDVPHAAQPVLFALAARANSRTAVTFSGGWLCETLHLHEDRVRAHVQTLTRLGVIAVDQRPGKASVIRFPLAGFIHTPRESDRGHAQAPPADSQGPPRGFTGGPPANPRGVSGSISGSISAPGCPSCGHHITTAEGVCPKCLYEPGDDVAL